ncbi:hypothetical protein L208DRAFT_1417010 [Tricholoma matsutake]|nr:hypothetical protein L208DRAFT_1418458 [Tricholoma matsutake 945]KAF8220251.1 hypothetical protein L208DRAFT_1417010 [Tricholoma matsutake 945]
MQVELALGEAGINYTRFEVDLDNKPQWYSLKINLSFNKVPAITYGGPIVPPDEPSPESHKITESLVLLDFVADLSNGLLPKEPILRAKARLFINAVSSIFVPKYYSVLVSGEPVEKLLASLESLRALLPAEGFVVGPELTIADISIAPFIARTEVALKNDLGAYDEGTGITAWQTFQTDEKYARIRKYFNDIKGRESFKNTFDEVIVMKALSPKLTAARAQRKIPQASH